MAGERNREIICAETRTEKNENDMGTDNGRETGRTLWRMWYETGEMTEDGTCPDGMMTDIRGIHEKIEEILKISGK